MTNTLPDDPRDYYATNTISLRDLAALYKGRKGCSLQNLKIRSTREGWVQEIKDTTQEVREKAREIIIQNKVQGLASIQEKLSRLQDLTLDVHLEFMKNLKSQVKDIQNPYLFDGERTNSIFQTAMNNAAKISMALIKEQKDASTEEEPAGFIVSPDDAAG